MLIQSRGLLTACRQLRAPHTAFIRIMEESLESTEEPMECQ